jgi:hypothetical protein
MIRHDDALAGQGVVVHPMAATLMIEYEAVVEQHSVSESNEAIEPEPDCLVVNSTSSSPWRCSRGHL